MQSGYIHIAHANIYCQEIRVNKIKQKIYIMSFKDNDNIFNTKAEWQVLKRYVSTNPSM